MPDGDDHDHEHTLVTGSAAGGKERTLQPGVIVAGNYQIKSEIGRGGMGVVYLAEHTAFGRQYALKALAPDSVDAANWQRFQTEGKAVARLDHANIVKVYDMGTDGPDRLYYVMDLLQGVSLAEYIEKKGILPLPEILEIFSQLCAGLGYAHKQGLVHRDVKPSNIILCSAANKKILVKIIDFGLVKLVGEANQIKQSLTATGQICGSPFYMSPEQCMGGQIDERSDVYSLGCTLFECLTGEPPFRGANGLETALMHQSDVSPELNELRPDKNYSDNIEQLVARMLEKQPAQRYQSMKQVLQDLQRVGEGKSVSRESIFADGPLFEIDQAAEKELQGPDPKSSLPLIGLSTLAAVVSIFVVWALVSHFSAKNETETASRLLVRDGQVPGVKVNGEQNRESDHARRIFADCPTISQGLIDDNGTATRLFNFPEVPLGLISWGPRGEYKKLARGKISVPASEHVTLQLTRSEGKYARMFPSVLAKIGPDDIYALEVVEPDDPVEDGPMFFEVPVPLVQIIAKWTALKKIEFYNCRVSKEAVLALSGLSSIDELNLRDALVDGENLARVKWLNTCKVIDLRATQHIDAVLPALANSPTLRQLCLDRTPPSIGALKYLAGCPKLVTISLSEAEIDDAKLAVVCENTNIIDLNLKRCTFTARSLPLLARLKRLKYLAIDYVPLDESDVNKLRQALPGCKITSQKAGTTLGGF